MIFYAIFGWREIGYQYAGGASCDGKAIAMLKLIIFMICDLTADLTYFGAWNVMWNVI